MTEVDSSEADLALAALWASDEPPVRDPLFELATMDRVNRRRWLIEAAEIAALAVPALAILWAAWPGLVGAAPQAMQVLTAYGPLAVCIGAIALVTWTTREVFAIDP